jgi:8-oxo-dGTP diphosphatase
MADALRQIRRSVERIDPYDELEAEHRDDVLAWLSQTDDVFRRRSPDLPDKHLVSYFAVFDEGGSDGRAPSLLLVDHRKAGLWLPPGGHVDVGEHPWATVQREAAEELSLTAAPTAHWGTEPGFVTVTRTRGPGSHLDVSLWFVLSARETDVIGFDHTEFRAIAWFSLAELAATDPTTLDPHQHRFLSKLSSQ